MFLNSNYTKKNTQNLYLQKYLFTLASEIKLNTKRFIVSSNINNCLVSLKKENKINKNNNTLSSYLAGLIEGGGTFAIHNKNSIAKKYYPMIIIVFKKNDLSLAQHLQNVTNCGEIYNKPNRGYVLWQIQDIVSIFTIVKLINGKMRTPKIEALQRTIDWLNKYIETNKSSNFLKTKLVLSKICKLELKPLDNSPIDSNNWFSGFSDADGIFSINIHKRSGKNSTRVQLYYRLEIKQTYHKLDSEGTKTGFFPIMSKLANFLGVNVYSRSRYINDKQFFSYTVIAHNKSSLNKIVKYFTIYPLLSSKYLDFKDWLYVLEKQTNFSQTSNIQKLPNTYVEEAIKIRQNFNKTRTTYNWDHLKNSYLTK
uniref:LAGLIDADG homing endonuclease n=1 Tax=Fuscoporia gilva TaxID=40471 RepID=UPI0023D866F6|nr:LAGLIDADG homing endonuclease [Fuscoporia gilva]WDD39622.1 LAGLIDADG homing endonuclease [Fuscoporia gilva]